MAEAKLPEIAVLRKLLRYEADTGKLFWLARDEDDFDGPVGFGGLWKARNWNAQYAGKEAFATVSDGYLKGEIFRRPYRAHRIAWAIYYGHPPSGIIDHINGQRGDNRIANLRLVSPMGNAQNARLAVNNSSGFTGVSFVPSINKWGAYITFAGKRTTLGYFSELDDAVAARKAAERGSGFLTRQA